MNDPVFKIIQQMLSASPKASYTRLNQALRGALGNCISADLPFQRDTFQRIFNNLRGHWWFGDGAGSAPGEHYYSHAISCNHASAIQSFERFAGRPGVLWEEDANIPIRLHVGAQFTWQGYYVTVTSMRADSLIACTYKDKHVQHGIHVGATISDYSQRENKHYVITSAVPVRTGAKLLRVIKAKANNGERDVAKRFTVTYDEIAKFRKTEKARLKKILALIAECDPKDAGKLSKQIEAEHFRHYQLEEINAAFIKRKDWLSNQERNEAWRAGANGAWLDVKENLLRVVADRVQCSNGNSVSVASVRRALPIVLDRRGETASLNLPLDGHTISRIDPKGVTVGCTAVSWAEIERIAPLLEK